MNKIQLPVPTLILCCGVAGSGKSTIARKLITGIEDALLVDKDTINESFLLTVGESLKDLAPYFLTGSPRAMQSPHYLDHIKFQTYHCMLRLARQNLQLGKHPIVDGNFTKEIQLGYLDHVVMPFFRETAHATHAMKILFCHAPEHVLRERMVSRGAPRDADKVCSQEAWSSFLKRQPIIPSELSMYDHLLVDTTHDLDENTRCALEYISKNKQQYAMGAATPTS